MKLCVKRHRSSIEHDVQQVRNTLNISAWPADIESCSHDLAVACSLFDFATFSVGHGCLYQHRVTVKGHGNAFTYIEASVFCARAQIGHLPRMLVLCISSMVAAANQPSRSLTFHEMHEPHLWSMWTGKKRVGN